ncbi:NAD(P)H dehydrogenase (quinone) [Streptosporangium becharense]|uniref:NAD(P)H dehydrogenase (Quinone) n=1 Tax=Streptosporangium becharense TaxID=1816182 RepID=A0A7W9IB98_9ACTN|nr:NAD(P)H-binding protein [Streptosporangium becharense]MBB2915303.1 NAD(P)H dehydrogenase (quinone) [Streptosporangium becharense]MBB5816999.1 NAD(P)H dehydrogenase (quinone) [Streptosporangium becharense]
MIVISAASGALGRLVVDNLRARTEVVAVVRDLGRAPEGVPARHGDYDDPASLRAAFDGASRLLLISSPELDPSRKTRQHLAAVAAAEAVGVGAIAFTSFLGAGTVATGMTEAYHATEQAILDSGLPYTMLRHPFYSDAFVPRISGGELTGSTGGRGLNTAFRSDLAEAAANVLVGEGHLGRAYDFTGPLWSHPEVAAALGVTYREVPDTGPGPMSWINGLVRAGALEQQTPDLERVLGRPAETVVSRLLGRRTP